MKRAGMMVMALFLALPLWGMDLTPGKLQELLAARNEGKAHFVLVDVRTPAEHEVGFIEGTDLLLPLQVLKARHTLLTDSLKVDPEKDTVIVYCRSGRRAGVAKQILEDLGFKHVFNAGGILQWQKAGYDLVVPASSSP